MKIGIVGAGSMGMTLARHLARLGHGVAIASPRDSGHLAASAEGVGARAALMSEVVGNAELVILAIPTKVVVDLPRALFASLPSSVVVIDLANYHPELRDGRIEAIEQGLLDSQWVARQIGRPVIKVFNNIFAKSLLEKGVAKGAPGRIALPVAGDSLEARATALRIVDELGFDPIDAGSLDASWRQGTGTPAYCKDLDAPALRRALAEADRTRIANYRAEEEARIRSSLAP
jgi:predicted dinucleotide-binding enzyme